MAAAVAPARTARAFKPAPAALSSISDKATSGWKRDLAENGYVVLKGAIPLDRALGYRDKAYEWLQSFGTNLDFDDPSTWTKSNLPIHSCINTFSRYSVCHEKFVWDARLEPGVVDTFAEIWGTNELLVSFDALNVTFPNRKDVVPRPPWEHVDQSPLRRGLNCIQGIINLSPAGPNDGGLVVYPGSHRLVEHFFDVETDSTTWKPDDIYEFSREELSWFESKGLSPVKVCAEPGDLIIWDSRTIHYGSVPSPESTQIRTVIYAAYAPASLASSEQLALKKQVFEKYGGTTHWPHDNIKIRETRALFEDGTRDPRDRETPRELPEKTDKLLKLAGALPY
ncbi:unnamed protein product [Clonostachys byssicola]|uniref:Phytanoyl-CoA dioxygenase n=1 Tax=Clonostachys byssicola TaxID=160290 RepID=A0A9N9UTX8_9HYPO|nr:unnamed protein product [Clonostachys byssicola]